MDMDILTDEDGRKWRKGYRPEDTNARFLPRPFCHSLDHVANIHGYENLVVLTNNDGNYYCRNNTNKMTRLFLVT